MDGWMVRTALKTKFRQVIACMFVMFCLVACSGGGGSSPTSQPPAGGTPPPGNSPPPGPTTTVPQFTRAFAQFLGTPSATAAADLNGDGRDDLVVVTTDFGSGAGSDQLYIFYQQADGLNEAKFVDTAGTFGNNTWSVALCDVDGDGQKEILVGYSAGDLTVYKLAADGTPFLSTTLNGVRSIKIICADIDGDGLSDVVTVGKPGVNMQVLLQRNGVLAEQGTYSSGANFVVGTSSGFNRPNLELGDINGDGKTDILFFSFSPATPHVTLNAYIQNAPGQFDPPITLDFPRDNNGNVPVGGFEIVDLRSNNTRNIVASYGGNAPSSKIVITSQGANGQTLSSISFTTLDVPAAIRVVDINADGRKDIVVFHDGFGALGIHYQNADGTFTEEQLLFTWIADQSMSGQVIAVGDFNSDGKRDIAVADQTALFVFFQQ